MIGRIIAKMAKRADIDAEFTGHSLRAGMAKDLTAAGFELSCIMQAGRWKLPEMPARYSARLLAKSGAVAGYYAVWSSKASLNPSISCNTTWTS
ncbi:MAG: hypothetical protein QF521_21590 [Alphaproteobacteria bacterium]|nr:hypothetical protein [Alphaproteobacteria bacterium]